MTLEMKEKSATCKRCGYIVEYTESDIKHMYIHHENPSHTDALVFLTCPECYRRIELKHKD